MKRRLKMPRGRPSVGREQYIRVKFRKETHALWVEMKRTNQFKSDNALARHLLSTVTVAPARVSGDLAMELCRFL